MANYSKDYPQNEICVIGALLLSDSNEHIDNCFAKITPRFFTVRELNNLFADFRKQWSDNRKLDTVLALQLGEEYKNIICSCMEQVPSPTLLTQYTDMLFQSHRMRILQKDLLGILQSMDGMIDTDVIINQFKQVAEIQDKFDEITSTSTSMNMLDSIVEYMMWFDKSDDKIKTGINSLDRITGGFDRKTFNVLSGRSGSGKSDFAIFLATCIAAKGKKVLYLSMEMPRVQIINRIASRLTMIDSMVLRDKKNLKDEHFIAITQCLDKISKLPIIFDEQQNLSMYDIKAKVNKHKPDVIFIDHIGLMASERGRKHWETVMENSKTLKQLAMKENTVIFALAQQTKDVEKRKDKGGNLSEIKGSDTIGNDADNVAFIYAEKTDTILSGAAWIDATVEFVKTREGKTGKILYHWRPQYHKYTEVQS